MPKNIIICCDGTGNEYGPNNTNVEKVFEAMERGRPNQEAMERGNLEQIGYYDPGVGTFSFIGRILGKKIGILLGQTIGAGLQQNIEDAYVYLMDRYEPEDHLFLFGFSRGAFTARALAGMLHKCGLLQKGSRNLVTYASKVYNTNNNDEIAAGFKRAFCHECKPYFIGVWDTVKSLGGFMKKKHFDQKLHGNIKYGYHAVSIDEKRKKFPISLWDERRVEPGETIEQVWFPGVHSDVGGWYDQRGLADTALRWMLIKAEAAGLRLRDDWEKRVLTDNPVFQRHESREGFYKIWRPAPRVIPEGALIHEVVRYTPILDPEGKEQAYNPKLPDVHKWVRKDGSIVDKDELSNAD